MKFTLRRGYDDSFYPNAFTCYIVALQVRPKLTYLAFGRPCHLRIACQWIPCWQYVHQPGAGCHTTCFL